jgi:hypothetical protein
MAEKYNLILSAEERFAREVALSVIVTAPVSVWHCLIPFMFVFDFLRRQTTTRRYTEYFMFPRKLALDVARDILEGLDKADRLSDTDPEVEARLNRIELYSPAIHQRQMEVIDMLVDHYLKLLKTSGDTYEELINNAYGNRHDFLAFLGQLAESDESLDKAILEKVGGNEKVREKILAEREQVKRLTEKKVDQIFQPQA